MVLDKKTMAVEILETAVHSQLYDKASCGNGHYQLWKDARNGVLATMTPLKFPHLETNIPQKNSHVTLALNCFSTYRGTPMLFVSENKGKEDQLKEEMRVCHCKFSERDSVDNLH